MMLIGILAISCGKTGETGKSVTPTQGAMKKSATIQFVSRLSDKTLFDSDNTADKLNSYIKTALKGKEGSYITILDRSDGNGNTKVLDMAVNTFKWSYSSVEGYDASAGFKISSILVNAPVRELKSYQLSSMNYLTGLDTKISGTIVNQSNETKKVEIEIDFHTSQINADNEADALIKSLATIKKPLIIGTVKSELFTSFKSKAESSDTNIKVKELAGGSKYKLFLLSSERFWRLNKVDKSNIADGIDAYGIDLAWF